MRAIRFGRFASRRGETPFQNPAKALAAAIGPRRRRPSGLGPPIGAADIVAGRGDVAAAPEGRAGADDAREALYNQGDIGPAGRIQLPAARITRLPAIVIDLDPGKLRPGNPFFPPAGDPGAFHARIRPALDRHPIARAAEIRSSGRGLHAIVRIEPAVELMSGADQGRWGAIVEAVQLSLPSDPDAPGITALTRPLGSINSRNGAEVRMLREAEPVGPEDVVGFAADLHAAPFRTIAGILLGPGRITPCPICEADGSSLAVFDRAGQCYGCGSATLGALLDLVHLPDEQPGRGRASENTARRVRPPAARPQPADPVPPQAPADPSATAEQPS